MRFLLINPFCPLSEAPSPPLGVAFLAAALEEAGVEVKILDLVTEPYDRQRFEALLTSFRPHVVGSTAVTMTFDAAKDVIRDAKAIDPDIVTVMGGPHVTFSVESTFEVLPELDLIVRGEGETTIVEVTKEACSGRNWGKVLGIAYRNGQGVECTGPRPPLDVNTLPLPARHLLPLGRYRTLNMAVSLTTSRGCPFPCIFCVGRRMVGAKVRYRNAMSVVDELEYLAGLGFPQVNFADDLFTAKKSHCFAICDEILHRGLKVKWSAFGRVGIVTPDLLKKMKQAGCATVGFGVESGNADILKTIKKKLELPKVLEVVRMCREADLDCHFSFILGLPGETPETLAETMAFASRIDESGGFSGYHLLAPFPGTAVREDNEKYDLEILTNDWSQYHANHAIVQTSSVPAAMLDEVVNARIKEFEDALAREKERLEAGGPSQKDDLGFENLNRILVYYDLMMSRAIEEKGFWQNGGPPSSDDDALRALVDRVYEPGKKTREEFHQILEYAVSHGHLSYGKEGDLIRWAWTEHL